MNSFTMDNNDPFDPGPAKMLLTIELVPSSSWGDNLRSRLSKAEWDKLRKAAYKAAGYRCEICNDVGSNQGVAWPVECHETWSYDESTHIQTLVKLISLCPNCHMVKHIGRAQVMGKHDEAVAHMQRVNKWTSDQAKAHIREAFNVWQKRSQSPWKLNLDALAKYGVGLPDGKSA